MPTRTEIGKMKKDDLVELGCAFFEDDGNLRKELTEMTVKDLREMLLDNGADEAPTPPEPEPLPELSPKPKKGPLDLGVRRRS
jgi:hypothetical protein